MATNGGPKVVESNHIILAADRHNHMLRSDSHNALHIIGRDIEKNESKNY